MSWRWTAALVGAAIGSSGCVTETSVPEPEAALERYVTAVERGDAEAIYALMSEESRRSMSREDLKRILDEQHAELEEHASALSSEERVVNARAEVRFDDGEIVTLDLEDGRFHLTAADALPAGAKTPAQALGQLRQVLARRSYTGLLRVLSPRTRAAIERDFRALVEGLTEPESLDIEVVGDRATVVVPGGHHVTLRRKDGVWHVDDFR